MPETQTLDLVLAAERDVRQNPARYRQAVEWWNANYSRAVYRKSCAQQMRQARPRPQTGEYARRAEFRQGKDHSWKDHNRPYWFLLARIRDAMGSFSRKSDEWRRIGTRDAARILLVTVLITRPDFDATSIGMHDYAKWSYGHLLADEDRFGRDWADGSFKGWNDESGNNGLWMKLAAAAWKVMQADGSGNGDNLPDGPPPSDGVDDLVNLDEAAAIVHRSKRTLERRLSDMPAPYVEGGGGKPNLWKWPKLRPWLEKEYVPNLPKRFPRNRPH